VHGGKSFSDSGSLVVGENATLYSPDDYGTTRELLGKGAKDVKLPEKSLPRNGGGDGGQKREWVEAIKKNDPKVALSNFDYAGMLTEAVLLGNVAIRFNKQRLEWDGPKMKVTNVPEANDWVTRKSREGWKL